MGIDTGENTIQILQRFKELSSNRDIHKELLLDKKAILYAATSLEHENVYILTLSLDIFENFVDNDESHVPLISTFGVYESLESLAIRVRNSDEEMFRRASEITEILRNAAPPAFSTRNRTNKENRGTLGNKQTVYLLYIPNLTMDTKRKFQDTLVKVKGVVSFLLDLEMKRCTLRICPKVTVKEVVEKISRKCGLHCLVIRKNKDEDVESYCDVLTNSPNRTCLEYPEEDFLQRSGAVRHVRPDRKSVEGLLSSVKTFWQKSFYW